jgi:hypothetical protein
MFTHHKKYGWLLILFLTWQVSLIAQVTKIRGKVVDQETKEPIPFVNIAFKGSTIGTTTDFNGDYFIETKHPTDTLILSSVGFQSLKFLVRKEHFQTINAELKPASVDIGEIEILAGENPAHILLDKVIERKPHNDPDKIEKYQCEVYSKIEIDVNNIDDKFKNQRALKQLQFVFDYVDTSVVTGKTYLPIFISESLSDFYYRKSPKNQREVIRASKVSGVKNESVSQFTGQMYQEINIYRNHIEVFDQPFVSPVATFAKLYYKYYLIDSLTINNHWCYNISFKPKRKQEFTFTGDFWVADTSFAIVRSKIRMAADANLNYINDMVSELDYSILDSTWFISRSKMMIDFNITDRSTGFFGRKTTSYKNVLIDSILQTDIFKTRTSVILEEDAYEKSDKFWQNTRHEQLSAKEDSIYAMVDSIKHVPVFRTAADMISTFVTGYYVHRNFEYGPYYTFVSYNEIEGTRFKLGGRTSNEFSTRVMYFGHLAYGTKDERFKYSLGLMYMFGKNPRESFLIQYKDDVEQLGKSQNAFLDDNILSSLLQRNPIYKLTRVQTVKTFYEKEWFQGFSNTVQFKYSKMFPTDSIPLYHENELGTTQYNELISTELSLNTRFAYKEIYVYGEFERDHISSDYPIINLDVTLGMKDVFNSDYDYLKFGLNIRHLFNTGTFGYFKYTMDAGKIFGRVPYPLLRLHEGNETYAFDDFAFNTMNYYEFGSDQYMSIYAEHHFMGLFLNKFPLLRKLQWREVVHAKALVGSLSDENNNFIMFPNTLSGLEKPFIEVGLGLENIFKIVRIDAMWRLSYLDKPEAVLFGIRAKLQLAL